MPSLATNKDKPPQPQFKSTDRRKGKRKQCKNEERGERNGKWRNTMCSMLLEKKGTNNQLLLTFRYQEPSTQLYLKSSVLPWIIPLSNRTIYFLRQTLIIFIILKHFPKRQCFNQGWPELKGVCLSFKK